MEVLDFEAFTKTCNRGSVESLVLLSKVKCESKVINIASVARTCVPVKVLYQS